MKYLKTFEAHRERKDLATEIAEDLLPRLQKIREEKGKFTTAMFDNYMEERGGNMALTDEVISALVNMGFDFDSDDDDDDDEDMYYFDDEEDVDNDEQGTVPPPPPGFEGYPGMEYSLN